MSDSPVKILEGYKLFRVKEETIAVSEKGHVIVSSWNHRNLCGEHWWTSIGNNTIWGFIVDLEDDHSYVLGKFFDKNSLQEFDLEKTQGRIAKTIVEAWRDKEIKKDDAHDLIDELRSCNDEHDILQIDFGKAYYDSVHYDFSYKQKYECDYWLNEIWVPFCRFIRKEIEEGRLVGKVVTKSA